jgi:hypothetical protein
MVRGTTANIGELESGWVSVMSAGWLGLKTTAIVAEDVLYLTLYSCTCARISVTGGSYATTTAPDICPSAAVANVVRDHMFRGREHLLPKLIF